MTEPERDETYEWADAIELAMEKKPLNFGWTHSMAARAAHLTTVQAREALGWMVENVYVRAEGNGAWVRYYRRH